MEYPRVSIIILNWNGLEDTIECLESLKKITYPNYEVIVVDNASANNEAQILREKFGDYIYLIQNDRNYGFAEGNNIAIRHVLSKSELKYVLLLNNDTVVAPQFLDELVKVTKQDCSIGIAGPKIYFYNNPNEAQHTTAKIDLYRGKAGWAVVKEADSGQFEDVQDTAWCDGSCFLVRREVIQSIGLIDASYFKYWEEIDYCLRASKQGFRIVCCPQARIWHKGWLRMWDKGFPSIKRVEAVYYMERNRFLFMRKHAGKLQMATFLLYYFTFSVWMMSGHLLVRRRSQESFMSFLRGVRDGFQLLAA
ncbi:MAG: glycosyltransferase family 2 protein [Dehalococcoidia bacterium]|jgi:hypothetical protein